MRYSVTKMGRFWWIKGDGEFGPIGPYDKRPEAVDDCRGLNRFLRKQDEPGFLTAETALKGNLE